MKSISHIPSPSSPPTFYPPTSNPPPPTVPISQSCPLLFIPKSVFKGSSQCVPAMSLLYFGPFNSIHCSPLFLPYSPAPIFQQLSVHILMSSTCTDVMFYDITDTLSFSFPFLPPPSSIEQFHYYKCVLPLSLYVIMFVLCICVSFGSFFYI
jgi:hypothetical protein